MSSLDDLRRVCRYELRAATFSEARTVRTSIAAVSAPIDAESPIGMNDTLLIAAYFRGGKPAYAMWPVKRARH